MWVNETSAERLMRSDTPELLNEWNKPITLISEAVCNFVDLKMDDWVRCILSCAVESNPRESYIMVCMPGDKWTKVDSLPEDISDLIVKFVVATHNKCGDSSTWWGAFNLEIMKNRSGVIRMRPLEKG